MSDDPSKVDDKKVIGEEQSAPQTQDEKEKAEALQEYSKVEANGELSMRVKIYSPFNDYFEGQAFSISAENATGPFDILPKHHNFISLLNPCEVVIRTVKKGDQRIKISGGIMHVKADQVVVFLDV
ncbi:hypothetical protein KC963_05255 [Candidatus Saccharibacteria bacterium]|nr:hypothetical protein [Candidatus Saccharibacteria bacterium]